MKKLLLQLDSDKHPSAFDRIVAYDAGADEVLSYGGVTTAEVTSLVHGAIFTRGPDDLHNTAIWIGGSSVATGEEMLRVALGAFFGPLRVSVIMDANGCNTTAGATVAAIAGVEPLAGKRALVAGAGPVALRVAELLTREGAQVIVVPPWRELLGDKWDAARAARDAAQATTASGKAGFEVRAIESGPALRGALEGVALAVSAGPLGVMVLPEQDWAASSTLRVLVDLNPVPPLGIEGVKSGDVSKTRNDRVAFGALGLGGLKMKVHKACVAKLFEARDQVFDAVAVYDVARSILR